MWSTLLATFAMMGLTFAIGFVVAAVIWLVAYWASSYEFYSTHKEELAKLKKIRRLRNRVLMGWGFYSPLRKSDSDYELSSYYQGEDDTPFDLEGATKYYHETSPGASDFGLMDYYYPSEAKIVILEHLQEEADRLNAEKQAKDIKKQQK